MTLKMDLVEKVPPRGSAMMSAEMIALVERAEDLEEGEILKIEGLEPGMTSAGLGGRMKSLRDRHFHTAVRTVNGVLSAYLWRKDSPAG